jgi:hypothetical protein
VNYFSIGSSSKTKPSFIVILRVFLPIISGVQPTLSGTYKIMTRPL